MSDGRGQPVYGNLHCPKDSERCRNPVTSNVVHSNNEENDIYDIPQILSQELRSDTRPFDRELIYLRHRGSPYVPHTPNSRRSILETLGSNKTSTGPEATHSYL